MRHLLLSLGLFTLCLAPNWAAKVYFYDMQSNEEVETANAARRIGALRIDVTPSSVIVIGENLQLVNLAMRLEDAKSLILGRPFILGKNCLLDGGNAKLEFIFESPVSFPFLREDSPVTIQNLILPISRPPAIS